MMLRSFLPLLVGCALTGAPLSAVAHEAHTTHKTDTSRPAGFAFALPQPGSYALPPIKRAAGGPVLDEKAAASDLGRVLAGRISVLAFIYTRCGDVCPATTLQMSMLQDLAAKHSDVAGRLQLVSMSFDPEHDTPDVLAQYAKEWRSQAKAAPPWRFLTAPDVASLQPMLDAYGQRVTQKPNPDDRDGPLYHLLRVVLVDRAGFIRNIYSLDFLDPLLILNDVRTLIVEETRKQTNR